MKDLSKLEVFSRGFLQDALTLMKVMESEGITRTNIKKYIKNESQRRQFGKPVGEPKPFSEKKNVGCEGCREKEKAELKHG